MIASLKSMAGENKELYSVLYTSFQQSKDLVEALDQWIASGGTREAFIDMLVKSEGLSCTPAAGHRTPCEKTQFTRSQNADRSRRNALGTDLGDNFFMRRWHAIRLRKGRPSEPCRDRRVCQRDVSVVDEGQFSGRSKLGGVGLMDFVPGGGGVKLLFTEGVDKNVLLLFIKDALYGRGVAEVPCRCSCCRSTSAPPTGYRCSSRA